MRRSTLIFIAFTICISVALFHIKYRVLELEQELITVHKQIFKNEETIHILEAEWSHLNDPSTLQKLSQQLLKLKPISSNQIFAFNRLPYRVNDPSFEPENPPTKPTSRLMLSNYSTH
ncbi:MAG: hypothetical protein HOI80_05620 [Alphaproteobacteria bacterium]|jgi:cell division protein FtsL|nr:hypothetical protein [Alphaproteobacteria bacterium]MBT5390006.1 hypothetical protein [Alphaproteobacteria bacterium]MBT5540902.1 hypothetical protein [Alphaproteobacteria bacterium]MBT5654955.1 hypothetical protein [Alphaproteobacteria bacterium]